MGESPVPYIHFVGAGPGAADLVTVRGARLHRLQHQISPGGAHNDRHSVLRYQLS